MKYDVHFSCGHTEVKELFGPTFGENEKGYQPRREKTPEEIATEKNQVSFL